MNGNFKKREIQWPRVVAFQKEIARSALGAYAMYQQTRAEVGTRKETLLTEFRTFGVKAYPEAFHQDVVIPFEKWLSRIPNYENLLIQDYNVHKRLSVELNSAAENDLYKSAVRCLPGGRDKARDTFLRGMGYDVLRIPVRAVREKPFSVIKQIGERLGLAV